jgi:hypothetical protein
LPYGLLADIVVVSHFLWILFLILGGWWGRRHRWLGRTHLAGLAFACLVEGFDWYCPLTHLEVWLRRNGAQTGYSEPFITHYLNRLIYIDLPHPLIVVLTLALGAVNAWLYLSKAKF